MTSMPSSLPPAQCVACRDSRYLPKSGDVLCREHGVRYQLPVYAMPRNSLPLDHDPHIRRWLNEHIKPGDVFYDIGANIGIFSLLGAALGAHVYAFEPVPTAAALIPDRSDIIVIPVALWDTCGDLTVTLTPDSQHVEVGNTSPYPHPIIPAELKTFCITLDYFVKEHPLPTVIKSDTQGCEAHWLRGAGAKALSQCRVIILEIEPGCLARHGSTPEDVYALLVAYGFVVTDTYEYDVLAVRT